MLETDVRDYLESVGVGTRGVDLFVAVMPNTPDVATVITVYPGLEPVRVHVTSQAEPPKISYEQPRFQIKTRAAKSDYSGGQSFIQQIYVALAQVKNMVLGELRYLSIEPLQTPYFLRWDENNRPEFVFNCQVYKEFG